MVYIVYSICQPPHFVNISQTAQMISIFFCMQFLFRIRRDDTKFRFDPNNIKGFFSWGQRGSTSKITITYIFYSLIFVKFGIKFLIVIEIKISERGPFYILREGAISKFSLFPDTIHYRRFDRVKTKYSEKVPFFPDEGRQSQN